MFLPSRSSRLWRGLDPFDDRWSDHQLFAIVPPWNMAPLSLLNRSGKLFCSYSLFSYLDNSTPWFGARHRSQCVWLGRHHNGRKGSSISEVAVPKSRDFFSSHFFLFLRRRCASSLWYEQMAYFRFRVWLRRSIICLLALSVLRSMLLEYHTAIKVMRDSWWKRDPKRSETRWVRVRESRQMLRFSTWKIFFQKVFPA